MSENEDFVEEGARLWSIPLTNVDGTYLPTGRKYGPKAVIKHVRNIKSMPLTKDDVVAAAYPKSGLHWVWEIIYRLQLGSATIPNSKHMEEYFMDQARVRDVSKSRALVSHLPLRQLPNSLMTSRCPLVYLLRDPRAVAVSLFNHLVKINEKLTKFTGKWDDFLQLFLDEKVVYNGWFHHTKQWERDIRFLRDRGHRVLVVHYEDLIQYPILETKRISDFLGKDHTLDFCGEVVKQTNIDTLRERREGQQNMAVRSFFTGREYPMYRKGITDDWKSWFTVKQNEQFVRMYPSLMENSCVKLKCML